MDASSPRRPIVDPSDRTLDAAGMVVMPGGVDMHCHIAGPKVNVARKMMPEAKRLAEKVVRTPLTRSGTMGSVPSTFATGYKYAGMGYTTAFDAAIPPLAARHAHEEFHDTPLIDKGFYVLAGNNHYVLEQIRDGEPDRLRNYLGWLINSTKAHTVKVVNPGGVEVWKSGGGNSAGLDAPIEHFGVTARQIVTQIARAAMELGLPHPMHLHCNNLGCRAISRRRSTPCGRWRVSARTSHTFSSTVTAATPTISRPSIPACRNWPTTSTAIRT